MTPRVARDAGRGPVLAGLLTPDDTDDVLRRAFREAEARGTAVAVVAAGAAARDDHAAELTEAVGRWSEKHPGVAVTSARRPMFDPAVALTAATGECVLAVVAAPAEARIAAVVVSLERRAHCPVVVLTEEKQR